ncbi:MAG TPA: hypothetical protein VGO40_07580 [Longimicrobium sp.]|jgi:hypothetical protein|nr:hypothetical protein [Longimicrobium sp.]
MYYDSADPLGGYGGGGYGGSGTGEDTGITGGTDAGQPPVFKPTNHGWWEFFAGAWHWMTDPPRATKVA